MRMQDLNFVVEVRDGDAVGGGVGSGGGAGGRVAVAAVAAAAADDEDAAVVVGGGDDDIISFCILLYPFISFYILLYPYGRRGKGERTKDAPHFTNGHKTQHIMYFRLPNSFRFR